ncbi:MAG: glycosyltransferase [Bacteroidales bacterium]|nr:glycosyltransferase [Bacteroidales bacterium]
MKLSVIIPVFNAEQTLAACVKSVVFALGVIDFEAVIVDDGSTDGTLALAEKLAAEFPAISVLHQENGGVASARNLGLKEARGEWVAFVDADDTLDPGCAGSLAKALDSSREDMLILRMFAGSKERYPWSGLFADGSVSDREGLMRKGYLRGSSCACIFRGNFLKTNKLQFPEGVRISEDTVFFAACLGAADSIRFADIPFYRIGIIEGSASRTYRDDDPEQLARAMDAVASAVQDALVRNYTIFKLMIVLASRSAAMGIPAKEVYDRCGLASRLPLQMDGIYAERLKIRILNLSFGLFRWLIALRDSLR